MSIIPITGDTEATGPLGPRDVLIPISGTVTPDRDSESVAAPRQTCDGHVHTEACRPLVGEDYPKGWMTCDEEQWQQLVEDVDTDQWVNGMLDTARAVDELNDTLACLRGGQSVVSVARVCPRPFRTGDDTHARQTRPTDTTRD